MLLILLQSCFGKTFSAVLDFIWWYCYIYLVTDLNVSTTRFLNGYLISVSMAATSDFHFLFVI